MPSPSPRHWPWNGPRRNDLPESLPEAIRILCDERLVELRKAASAIVEPWRKTYQEGRETHRAGRVRRRAKSSRSSNRSEKTGYRQGAGTRSSSRSSHQAEPRRALANLLAMVEAKFHGICPNGTNGDWRQFWIARYRNMGGTRAVQAYLCPPRLVVSAIAVPVPVRERREQRRRGADESRTPSDRRSGHDTSSSPGGRPAPETKPSSASWR